MLSRTVDCRTFCQTSNRPSTQPAAVVPPPHATESSCASCPAISWASAAPVRTSQSWTRLPKATATWPAAPAAQTESDSSDGLKSLSRSIATGMPGARTTSNQDVFALQWAPLALLAPAANRSSNEAALQSEGCDAMSRWQGLRILTADYPARRPARAEDYLAQQGADQQVPDKQPAVLGTARSKLSLSLAAACDEGNAAHKMGVALRWQQRCERAKISTRS